jgi:hypothetical protein
MGTLAARLASLPEITVQTKDFERMVITADLFVLVLDDSPICHESLELIRMRCKISKALRIFTPLPRLPDYLSTILEEARKAEYYEHAKLAELTNRHPDEWEAYAYSLFPNPTQYQTEEDIFGSLESLILRHVKAPEVIRLVC